MKKLLPFLTRYVRFALLTAVGVVAVGFVAVGCESSDDGKGSGSGVVVKERPASDAPPTATGDGPYGLYTMSPDGSDAQQIYRGDQARNHAHVSPDGQWLVFSEFNQDTNQDGKKNEADLVASDISIMSIHGSAYDAIAHRYGYDLTPVWSPDGRSILYSSDRDNSTGILDLFRYDLDTRRVTNLTRTPSLLEGDPHWRGGQIVFNRLLEGVMTLWTMDQDGTNERQLTAPDFADSTDGAYPLGDFDPKLSPDGSSVVFARHLDNGLKLGAFIVGRWSIMQLDIDTNQEATLIANDDANAMPTWSSDGATIAYWAFVREPLGASRIFTVPAVGGPAKLLVADRDDLQVEMPDWYQGPEGMRLVFSGETD